MGSEAGWGFSVSLLNILGCWKLCKACEGALLSETLRYGVFPRLKVNCVGF